MEKGKDKEFLDAATDLATALMQRSFGMATDADVEEAREKALRAKQAAQEETIQEVLKSCDALPAKQRRQHEMEVSYRGPKVGTNLGDLLRASGAVKP